MPRKKSNLFSEADQEKSCINYLRERGYAIFKAGEVSAAEEEEAVRKLRSVGYKVEHIKNALIKIDATQIKTVDDIAVYFHQMMKRHNPKRHNERRLEDPKLRLIDHSVINYFISWRMDEGSSLTDAIEDMFLLIDVLFEKQKDWHIDVRGIGILSANTNKPFVLALMKEAKLKKDARLDFKTDQLIKTEEAQNYVAVLIDSRNRLDKAQKPTSVRRKIKVRGIDGKKT